MAIYIYAYIQSTISFCLQYNAYRNINSNIIYYPHVEVSCSLGQVCMVVLEITNFDSAYSEHNVCVCKHVIIFHSIIQNYQLLPFISIEVKIHFNINAIGKKITYVRVGTYTDSDYVIISKTLYGHYIIIIYSNRIAYFLTLRRTHEYT